MSKGALTRYALVFVVCVVLVSIFYLSKKSETVLKTNPDLVFHSGCLLNKLDCSLHLMDELTLQFRILPEDIKPLEPFELIISSSGLAVSDIGQVNAWFEGRDMEMGRHFLSFQGNDLEDAANFLLAKGMIPVCTIDPNMLWRLVINFEYQGKVLQVNFDVSVEGHGA